PPTTTANASWRSASAGPPAPADQGRLANAPAACILAAVQPREGPMKQFVAAVAAAAGLWAGAASAYAQTPAHLAAADDLLVAMDARAQYESALVSAMDAELAADPSLAPYRDVMLGFLQEYVSWERVKGDYARVYAQRFSEADLREVTAFYRTPVGRRFAEKNADVANELAQINTRIVESNQDELVSRIIAAAAEQE